MSGPFSSWSGPRTALNCSYRGDSLTRAWHMGLRVRAAQTETRKGLNTKGYPSTYLAMGFANVRAGTQKRRVDGPGCGAPRAIGSGVDDDGLLHTAVPYREAQCDGETKTSARPVAVVGRAIEDGPARVVFGRISGPISSCRD